jgi:hypothetical protein
MDFTKLNKDINLSNNIKKAQTIVDTVYNNATSEKATILNFDVALIDYQGKIPNNFSKKYESVFKKCQAYINELYGSNLPFNTYRFGHGKANINIVTIKDTSYDYIRSECGKVEIAGGDFDVMRITAVFIPIEECKGIKLKFIIGSTLIKNGESIADECESMLFSNTTYL